ncbi:MAG TPA: adenine deaminase C-terminal domain-containing protein [Candidatus Acidoferrales bacterium]|nr:adenine deaminase C-terminal domain-containing protein [Candidatus Acidoferrales bacterium]
MCPNRPLLEAGLGIRKASSVVNGGRLVNVVTGEVYAADVAIYDSKIVAIGDVREYIGSETEKVDAQNQYLVPGLIDGHIHFEVTKLSVTMFAKLMLSQGTTSIITSLDQIFGAGGLSAVRNSLNESKKAHLRMFFGAPCKLPYTIPSSTLHYNFGSREHAITNRWEESVGVWETLGRFVVGSADGKVGPDKQVSQALQTAYKQRLPAYGSASMLRGKALSGYICAGIRSDHEAYSPEEFLEKLRNGLFYMIRESSVVHFLDDYIRTIVENKLDTRRIAFCTDDVTASDVLQQGHVNSMVRRAIELGIEPIKAIQMATVNCAEIYHIDSLVGSISPGRFADILLVDELEKFSINKVLVGGQLVAADGRTTIKFTPPKRAARIMRSMNVKHVLPKNLQVRTSHKSGRVRAISMEIVPEVPFVRKRREVILDVSNGVVASSPDDDVLHVAVIERHRRTGNVAVAFISGFGLKHGAIASSTAPDDNNIVCIGVGQDDMAAATNKVIDMNGGQVVVRDGRVTASIALPIAGIIADTEPEEMAEAETKLDNAAKELGSKLNSPFMSMIFLEITGIPDYAIIDKGLVDCNSYKIVSPILGPA